MMDWATSGWSATAGASVGTSTQMTAGGPALLDRGNASRLMVAPSGATRGIPLAGSYGGDVADGRLSLGMLQVAVIGLVLLYLWTRNVQGGG